MTVESDVDADRFLYLYVLGLVIGAIEDTYPGASVESGTKLRSLAELITFRLIVKAELTPA